MQSVSPGLVFTELLKEFDTSDVENVAGLAAEDVADAVVYVLGTPAHVQVYNTVLALGNFIELANEYEF